MPGHITVNHILRCKFITFNPGYLMYASILIKIIYFRIHTQPYKLDCRRVQNPINAYIKTLWL